MRVGFISPFAVEDPTSWSGIVSPMFAALADHVDLVRLERPDRRHHLVDRAATRLLGAAGQGYLPDHGLATSRAQAAAVASVVRRSGVDVVAK